MNNVEKYFDENPDAKFCYEALGYICATREEAEHILKGVPTKIVIGHSREGAELSKESEKIMHAIGEQEKKVQAAQGKYEAAMLINKGSAMTEWEGQKKTLADLQGQLSRALHQEAKQAADAATETETEAPAASTEPEAPAASTEPEAPAASAEPSIKPSSKKQKKNGNQ